MRLRRSASASSAPAEEWLEGAGYAPAPSRGSGPVDAILPGMDRETAYRRMHSAEVARLATINADGTAHLVPIVFVLRGETLYTAVDGKPKRSRRLRRIENARSPAPRPGPADPHEAHPGPPWWGRP